MADSIRIFNIPKSSVLNQIFLRRVVADTRAPVNVKQYYPRRFYSNHSCLCGNGSRLYFPNLSSSYSSTSQPRHANTLTGDQANILNNALLSYTNVSGHTNALNVHCCMRHLSSNTNRVTGGGNNEITSASSRANILIGGFTSARLYMNQLGHDKVFRNKSVCGNILSSQNPCAHFSSDRHDSVEKRLMKLMDMWEVEKAVKLVNDSVQAGVTPHQNIVLNLLQQLAHLGEYEALLELHAFLLDHKLCTDTAFFRCLHEAYHNSGRVDEGVLVLRLIYHRTRKYEDIDVFFTLLTVMILRHFPDRLSLIQQFVQDLKDAEKPVLKPEAGLWKCFMLTERFDEAEELLRNNEQIRRFIPQMVTDICSRKNQVDCDYNVVLLRLLELSGLKQKLRVLVLETYAHSLCQTGKLDECLRVLMTAKSQALPLHPENIRHLLRDLSNRLTSDHAQSCIQEMTTWLDTFE